MIPTEHYSSQLQQLQSECQYVITVTIMALSRKYKFLLWKLEVEFNKFPWKQCSVSAVCLFHLFSWVSVISFWETVNKVTFAVATAVRAKYLSQYLWAGYWILGILADKVSSVLFEATNIILSLILSLEFFIFYFLGKHPNILHLWM